MTTLVFGKTGQVATELQARGTADTAILAIGREEADLSDPEACAAAIATHQPTAVINAAAYTAVDKAEEEEKLATALNGDAPAAMAQACAHRAIPFVHISTDYVFDGTGEHPWSPDDLTNPIGAYGRSKLAGERGIAQAGGCYAILRTSWVFSAHGNNFVKTMLRLGAERDALSIVADQIGGPTSAGSIAAACLKMAEQLASEPHKTGSYHFSAAPEVSWADFAREIFAQANLDCAVADLSSADYPTPAARPLNSRLDCSATEAVFGVARPDWRSDLSNVIKQLAK